MKRIRDQFLAVESILLNQDHPRHMDEVFDDAHPLVQSLRESGMWTPMVVSDQEDGTYVIIDGNRRMQSAQYLGWKVVPCRVFQKLDHGEMLMWKFKFNNIRKA